jgi:hypothetical protein
MTARTDQRLLGQVGGSSGSECPPERQQLRIFDAEELVEAVRSSRLDHRCGHRLPI